MKMKMYALEKILGRQVSKDEKPKKSGKPG